MDAPVRVRVVTTCDRLGLRPPPARVRLKIFRAREQWVMLAWTTSPDLQGVVDWMSGHGPCRVHIPVDPRHRVVRFEFERAPPPVATWPEEVTLVDAGLEPEGLSPLTLSGPRDRIAAVVQSLGSEAILVLPRGPTGGADRLLTARQLDALRAAVASGHYEVPRSVGLRELGEQLGISSPALSELLRRAERRIIEAYISGLAQGLEKDPLDAAPPAAEEGAKPRRARRGEPADERLDSMHEELRSTMEEQSSLNEQLQSRNEELEAVNEELHSTNDELAVVGSELRQRTDDAERLSALLRAAVETSPEALAVLDPQFHVVAWGPAAERLLRQNPGRALGKSLGDLLPAAAADLRTAARKAQDSRSSVEVRLVLPSGTEVRATLRPTLDRAGNLLGWNVTLPPFARNQRP